ncbi:MAG: TIGR04372 family glycosyltransferase [Candidatus Omnitrophica bacterium]|nr:TIGR04372 family glycosyltransferase [Candidatus Omnitrophota bacterium]
MKMLLQGRPLSNSIPKSVLPLGRKILGITRKCFLLVVASPFILLLLVFRPFLLIRLGLSDMGRIGGFYYAVWYLAERSAGLHKKRCLDLFFIMRSTGGVSNCFWLKLWERRLNVFPFWKIGYVLYSVCREIPWLQAHVINIPDAVPFYGREYLGLKTQQCILNYKEPSLVLTPEEESAGRDALKQMGIPEDKPFICFHSRDSKYLEKTMPQRDWGYHDFRDSDIKNYIPAVEEMTWRGYYGVRMGAVVAEKVETGNPAIIDYATNGKRTDFLDIYLGARCYFFICSDTGISVIPEVFRRPIVFVNWVPLLRSPAFYVHNAILIPKTFFSRKENRQLTFQEIIHSALGSEGQGAAFALAEIDLIENTPEEIAAVTLEMEERLNGTWKTTEEDEDLQRRFWKLYEPYQLNNPSFRIGAQYLREHKDLLD